MTPEAAKLIRHKFPSRAEWRRHLKLANTPPRDPGSREPFRRIKELTQEAVDANAAFQTAVGAFDAASKVTLWRVVTFWLERRRERALEILAAAMYAAQIRVVKVRDAMAAYRSRGHGRGTGHWSQRVLVRSKYKPHQGARECNRRRDQATQWPRDLQDWRRT